MGYNTACMILNDQLHMLADRENVGKEIQSAVMNAGYQEQWRGPCGFRALPSQHADSMQVVAVGGNMIRHIGFGHYRDDNEALLRKLADQLGFRLVRKPRTSAPAS